jgi:hypothetical protein
MTQQPLCPTCTVEYWNWRTYTGPLEGGITIAQSGSPSHAISKRTRREAHRQSQLEVIRSICQKGQAAGDPAHALPSA